MRLQEVDRTLIEAAVGLLQLQLQQVIARHQDHHRDDEVGEPRDGADLQLSGGLGRAEEHAGEAAEQADRESDHHQTPEHAEVHLVARAHERGVALCGEGGGVVSGRTRDGPTRDVL